MEFARSLLLLILFFIKHKVDYRFFLTEWVSQTQMEQIHMTIPLNLQAWISSASPVDRLGTTQLAQMMSCPQFWEANDLQPIERLSSYCSRVPPRFMAMIAPGVKPPGVPFRVPAQVWPLPPSYKPTHNLHFIIAPCNHQKSPPTTKFKMWDIWYCLQVPHIPCW